jgi:hypothetical protein
MSDCKYSNILKDGVHVNRKESEGEIKVDASSRARFGQRRQDHNHQEVQRRRHQLDLTHPRIQYQVTAVRILQIECLGHRRTENHSLLLAQLLRTNRWSHLGRR